MFIFCDKQTANPKYEDETNLLISLSISQYLQGESFANNGLVPRILIEVLLPDTRTHLGSLMAGPSKPMLRTLHQNQHHPRSFKPCFSVLCILELKLALIAQSCLGCCGLIPLICNLCRSLDIERANEVSFNHPCYCWSSCTRRQPKSGEESIFVVLQWRSTELHFPLIFLEEHIEMLHALSTRTSVPF